jgi:hypothetical protein
MKPVDLRKALTEELSFYYLNTFLVLAEMKTESPYDYNIIENFVKRCKDVREKITAKKEG